MDLVAQGSLTLELAELLVKEGTRVAVIQATYSLAAEIRVGRQQPQIH